MLSIAWRCYEGEKKEATVRNGEKKQYTIWNLVHVYQCQYQSKLAIGYVLPWMCMVYMSVKWMVMFGAALYMFCCDGNWFGCDVWTLNECDFVWKVKYGTEKAMMEKKHNNNKREKEIKSYNNSSHNNIRNVTIIHTTSVEERENQQ